jgi:hypothetical protein
MSGYDEMDNPESQQGGMASFRLLQFLMLGTMLAGMAIATLGWDGLGSVGLTIGGIVVALISGAIYAFMTLRA